MRAYAIDRYGDLDQLSLRDLDSPRPGAAEVLVRVKAAALNPADSKVLSGRDGGRFLHASRFPLVLGFDFSGVVEAWGPEVQGLEPGVEVFGHLPYSRKNRQGSLADYVAVPADTVAEKPAAISHIEAACAATAASTGLQGLRDKGGLASGQRVLINGASGGVGSYAVQIAKRLSAGEVWGTASAAKLGHVESLGADRAIDYRTTRLAELDGPFDIVLDAASTSSYGACRSILAPRGTYVTLLPSFGLLTGLARSLFSRRRVRIVVVQSRRESLTQLADWMADGQFQHPIEATYALEALPEALEHLRSGRAKGKIGIVVG